MIDSARTNSSTSVRLGSAIPLVFFIGSALAQDQTPVASKLTSANHPRLARTLAETPEADADRDGVLSLAEYRATLVPVGKAQQGQKGQTKRLPLLANGDILIADFQEPDIGRLRRAGWKTEGDAFHRGPAHSTKVLRRRVGEFHGRFFISSLGEVDSRRRRRTGMIGKLISPEFEIELPYIEFLMSGGDHPGRVCVRLISAGQVLRTVTGENDDTLKAVAFDVKEFRGRKVHIEIVDRHRGLWGHINVDNVRQTLGLTRGSGAPRLISSLPKTRAGIRVTIQTLDASAQAATESGSIGSADGKLTVGGTTISLDRLLVATLQSVEGPEDRRTAVRMVDGEVWQAEVRGIEKAELEIRSALLGHRKVAISRVASVDFNPNADDRIEAEPGTLHRRQGDPIPGKLVWIRDKDIAIDCALGVLPIPRPLVTRYVFKRVNPVRETRDVARAAGVDEVTLVDGTRLRGSLSEVAKGLELRHSVLGTLPLRWDQVSSLRRSPAGVIWFDQLSGEIVERAGPVSSPPPPQVIETQIAKRDGTQAGLSTLRMMPRTVTRYDLPDSKSSWTLRTRLAPIAGSRADLRASIQVDGKLVWKGDVRADDEPKQLTVKIPRGKAMTISVDFAGRVAFPCGIDWWDGHLLLRGSK